jgi:hypothetical protein
LCEAQKSRPQKVEFDGIDHVSWRDFVTAAA